MSNIINTLKESLFGFGPKSPELQKTYYKGIVYLGDKKLAWGTSYPGDEFNLTDFYDNGGLEIEYSDSRFPVSCVYVRTKSNNVYAFKKDGDKRQLLNGEVGFVSNLANVDMRSGRPLMLRVGDRFYYQAISDQENPMFLNTTEIVEIVMRSGTELSEDLLKKMAGGRESDILKQFSELRQKKNKTK